MSGVPPHTGSPEGRPGRLGTVGPVSKLVETSTQAKSDPGRGRRLRYATAALLLLVAAGYVVYHLTGGGRYTGCTVAVEDGGQLRLDTRQAANATTIAAVATSRGLPERALTIALATAMQESALHNLDHGDRDSLGLFQQRPSQGWGTAEQIMDPVYSAGEFFDGLVKIQGYSRLPLTVAAQRVQKSGYPQAYAKHETDAALLASALAGRRQGALNCAADEVAADGTAAGDPGRVRERLAREFGRQVAPRPRPGAGTDRTVRVPSAPAGGMVAEEGRRRGWVLAQWAVAHADDLKVTEVSFDDRRWRADDAGGGWRRSDAGPSGSTDGDVRITVAG